MASWSGWDRAQVFGLAPEAYRARAEEALPALETLSGEVSAWYDNGWHATARLTPRMNEATPTVTLSASAAPDAALPFNIEAVVAQDDGRLTLQTRDLSGQPSLQAKLESVDAAAWTRAWRPEAWPAGFGAVL